MLNNTPAPRWYNFRTEQYEKFERTDDYSAYIPQSPAAQGLYRVHILMGKAPLEAALEVLKVCTKAS